MKEDIARLDCVTEKAGFMELPQQCITCLTMVKLSPRSVFSECLGAVENQMNVPGLLILSKRKLRHPKMVYFRPNVKQLLPRGYLMTEVPVLHLIYCEYVLFIRTSPLLTLNVQDTRLVTSDNVLSIYTTENSAHYLLKA